MIQPIEGIFVVVCAVPLLNEVKQPIHWWIQEDLVKQHQANKFSCLIQRTQKTICRAPL